MSKTKVKIDKIGIAGAGGIGSFAAMMLFDYGAKRNQFDFSGSTIDIYDDDVVDASNLLHQNFSEEDLGKYKAEIVSERCAGLINAHKQFMTEKDFKDYDIIFSAVDSLEFRKKLYNYSFDHPELFWIDGRCSSRQIGLYHAKLDKKVLEKAVEGDSKERGGCLLEYDKKNKTSHVTPQIIAGMMVQTFLNYIREDLQLDRIVTII